MPVNSSPAQRFARRARGRKMLQGFPPVTHPPRTIYAITGADDVSNVVRLYLAPRRIYIKSALFILQ